MSKDAARVACTTDVKQSETMTTTNDKWSPDERSRKDELLALRRRDNTAEQIVWKTNSDIWGNC